MSSAIRTPCSIPDRCPIVRHLLFAVAAAVTMLDVGACAANPPPVPVYASRADWETLSGHWRGSYSTSAPARRGLIDFTLSAGDEHASGDVMMIAEGTRVPYRAYPPGDPRLAPIEAPYTQLLTIKFVRAAQGQISGTIASYWDPDRSCQASATFLGSAQPRAIDGTFTSTCEDGIRQLHGKWRVTREPAPPPSASLTSSLGESALRFFGRSGADGTAVPAASVDRKILPVLPRCTSGIAIAFDSAAS